MQGPPTGSSICLGEGDGVEGSCIDLSWGSGVQVIEHCDHIWCMDIIVCSPAVVPTVITLPLDEILEAMPANVAIEDPLNLKFLVTLNQDQQGWQSGPSTGDGVISCGVKFHDWEYWVKVTEGGGQLCDFEFFFSATKPEVITYKNLRKYQASLKK